MLCPKAKPLSKMHHPPMEISHFIQTVSHLFPSSFSSCQFQILPDVEESCMSMSKSKNNQENVHHNGLSSSSSNKPQQPFKIPKNDVKVAKSSSLRTLFQLASDEARKSPIVTPFSTLNKMEKEGVEKSAKILSRSSSWVSDLFSSCDEECEDYYIRNGNFFSLSSNSGESFHQKTDEASQRKHDIKHIQCGKCSSEVVAITSFDKVLSEFSQKATSKTGKKCEKTTKKVEKRGKTYQKTGPMQEKCLNQRDLEVCDISTELYYSDFTSVCRQTRPESHRRRRRSTSYSLDHIGWTEKSYAVEKCSNDPRSDFRASMVEMIVENQIFGAKELERLLHDYLYFNAVAYHGVILDAFTEICETLFTNFLTSPCTRLV